MSYIDSPIIVITTILHTAVFQSVFLLIVFYTVPRWKLTWIKVLIGTQSVFFYEERNHIRALDLFTRCVKRSVAKGHLEQHIVIYGGEPTLNKKVFLEVLRYIDVLKEKELLPKTVLVTVNTNSILLGEEILTQCKTTEVVVAISIDGPKEIHDQMRVYSSGKGTFDEVVHSYRLAQQSGVKTGVCVTIDRRFVGKTKRKTNYEQVVIQAGKKRIIFSRYFFKLIIDKPCLINSSAFLEFLYVFSNR